MARFMTVLSIQQLEDGTKRTIQLKEFQPQFVMIKRNGEGFTRRIDLKTALEVLGEMRFSVMVNNARVLLEDPEQEKLLKEAAGAL